jgi:hypothetical protein
LDEQVASVGDRQDRVARGLAVGSLHWGRGPVVFDLGVLNEPMERWVVDFAHALELDHGHPHDGHDAQLVAAVLALYPIVRVVLGVDPLAAELPHDLVHVQTIGLNFISTFHNLHHPLQLPIF